MVLEPRGFTQKEQRFTHITTVRLRGNHRKLEIGNSQLRRCVQFGHLRHYELLLWLRPRLGSKENGIKNALICFCWSHKYYSTTNKRTVLIPAQQRCHIQVAPPFDDGKSPATRPTECLHSTLLDRFSCETPPHLAGPPPHVGASGTAAARGSRLPVVAAAWTAWSHCLVSAV